jgi:hypothetical protein
MLRVCWRRRLDLKYEVKFTQVKLNDGVDALV